MNELISIASQIRRDIVRMVHGANSGTRVVRWVALIISPHFTSM